METTPIKKVTFALTETSPTVDVYLRSPEEGLAHAEKLTEMFLRSYSLSQRWQRTLMATYHPADGYRSWQLDLEGLVDPKIIDNKFAAIEEVTPRLDTPQTITERIQFDYATESYIGFTYGEEGRFVVRYAGKPMTAELKEIQ